MTMEELRYKEAKLRDMFKCELETVDVDGNNDLCHIKHVKTIGVLWHLTHQLIMAEEKDSNVRGSVTNAETMNIQATGLSMRSVK